jgi:chloramphenicol O-acetyltransferase type A
MRTIDLKTWLRRGQFEMFKDWDYPHFNLCANIDLTTIYPLAKQHDIRLTAAIVYVLARAANTVPEFRLRIHGEEVVEHEVVHPSFTVLAQDDLFSFCLVEYTENFPLFSERVAQRIAYMSEHPTLKDPPGQDNLLYMTALPWVSFTSFMHPMNLTPIDSVPRFAWGKFFQEGQSLKMPLSVQAHHALMDGIHMGRYYEMVQEYLDHPDFISD